MTGGNRDRRRGREGGERNGDEIQKGQRGERN